MILDKVEEFVNLIILILMLLVVLFFEATLIGLIHIFKNMT